MKSLRVVNVSAEILTEQHLNTSQKSCRLNKIVWSLSGYSCELGSHVFLTLIGYQLVA
jgi:hypothetical protein